MKITHTETGKEESLRKSKSPFETTGVEPKHIQTVVVNNIDCPLFEVKARSKASYFLKIKAQWFTVSSKLEGAYRLKNTEFDLIKDIQSKEIKLEDNTTGTVIQLSYVYKSPPVMSLVGKITIDNKYIYEVYKNGVKSYIKRGLSMYETEKELNLDSNYAIATLKK